MYIYYLIFIVFILIALLEDTISKNAKTQILFLCGVFLILFSGFRSSEVGADYKTYEVLFKSIQRLPFLFSNPVHFFENYRLEPSFLIISSFTKTYFSDGIKIIMFSYALLGISLKIKAIQEIAEYKLLSILIYFSSVFFLHDMNQIRAGVAIGFLLLSIPHIVERNFKKFILLLSIAVLFHYSAIIFIIFYFLNYKKIDQITYLLILIIPIILCLFKVDPIHLLEKLDFGIFSEKIKSYAESQKTIHNKINIFNFGILIQIVISLFFILFAEKSDNKFTIILTKISCFGVAFFYLFSAVPVIAFREFELLSSVQIFLIPLSIKLIKPNVLAQSLVFLVSMAYFLNQMLINSIFKSYSTFLFN